MIARIARLIVVAALAVGCGGPAVIWSGRTPDRHHRVEVIEDAGLHYVVIDGERRAGYRAIAAWSMAFSPDGHLAFAAQVGPGWVVVRDGRAGPRWDTVGELALGPGGRLAYAAERAGGWHVVVDGVAGPRFDAILAGSLQVGAGGRVAYVGRSGRRVSAVVDGVVGPRFDGIGQLVLGDDGRRVAYAARDGQGAHAVVDGAVGPPWRAIDHLTLAPRGDRVAYAARDGRAWRVVVDGEPGPAVDRVRRVRFRDDGRHLAWLGRIDDRDVLALDGAPIATAAALRDDAIGFRPAAAASGVGLAFVMPVGGGGERVVVDGVAAPIHDEIGTPAWSNDGRLAYPARRGDAWVMVVDGAERRGGAWVSAPVWSPDGRRLGYLVQRGRDWRAVIDGKGHRFGLVLDGTLAFSRDGRRWSVVAGDLTREQLFFAVDGVTRVPLPAIELYSAATRGDPLRRAAGPADHPLLDWSRAEADRAR